MTLTWTICIVAAYVIGSIPFGVLLGKMRGVDIRQHGSKNVGATNVGRVLGRPLGLLCFFLDFLKGAAPVVVSGIITGMFGQPVMAIAPAELWMWLAVAMAAVLGHMFSIFLMLRGGKGVATGFGAMLAMWPVLTMPALGGLAVWFIILMSARIMSVASMGGAMAVPVALLILLFTQPARDLSDRLWHGWPALIATTALSLLVIWRHRANIRRLARGEEPKIGSGHR